MYYRICEYCGAALDPNEQCDCIMNMAILTGYSEEGIKKENALDQERAFSKA